MRKRKEMIRDFLKMFSEELANNNWRKIWEKVSQDIHNDSRACFWNVFRTMYDDNHVDIMKHFGDILEQEMFYSEAKKVVLPDNFKLIKAYAIQSDYLEEITLPNNPNLVVQDDAFISCYELKIINIPNSVNLKNIARDAFTNPFVEALKEINYKGKNIIEDIRKGYNNG